MIRGGEREQETGGKPFQCKSSALLDVKIKFHNLIIHSQVLSVDQVNALMNCVT